jgi:hypothetical protein
MFPIELTEAIKNIVKSVSKSNDATVV